MGWPNGIKAVHTKRFVERMRREFQSEKAWRREVESMSEGEKKLRRISKRRL
jgi:hypothetical protein